MAVSYKPLWSILSEKNMSKIQFQKYVGISGNLLAKLGKDEYISMKNLELICKAMDISPNEVLLFY